MKDYKNTIQPDQDRITLIEITGAACFFLLMFLPFSREAWAALIALFQ